MNARFQLKGFGLVHLVVLSEALSPILDILDCLSSRADGFDFADDALGEEFAVPLPIDVVNAPAPIVGSKEFDLQYRWFIS